MMESSGTSRGKCTTSPGRHSSYVGIDVFLGAGGEAARQSLLDAEEVVVAVVDEEEDRRRQASSEPGRVGGGDGEREGEESSLRQLRPPPGSDL